jgi:hypothetical protein
MWGLIAAFVIGTVIAVISIYYRRKRSKAFFAVQPPGAVFGEVDVAGRSTKNWLTRWGVGRGLRVSVTKEALVVHPQFPSTLSFAPELLDLEHIIPLASVVSIAKAKWWLLSRPALAITFEKNGERRSIELALREPGPFLLAMRGEWP